METVFQGNTESYGDNYKPVFECFYQRSLSVSDCYRLFQKTPALCVRKDNRKPGHDDQKVVAAALWCWPFFCTILLVTS